MTPRIGYDCRLGLDYEQKSKIVADKINEIHDDVEDTKNSIKEVCRHTENLSGIKQALERMESTLVDAATGRKQVPLSVALLMVGVLGTVLLILLVDKTNKSIELTATGIKISDTNRDTSPK